MSAAAITLDTAILGSLQQGTFPDIGRRESPELQESTAPLRKARARAPRGPWLAVRGQLELDRQVEQRTEPSEGWLVLSSRTSCGRPLV